MAFERDPNDWLRKLSPDEWIRAALGDLRRAEAAMKAHDARAGIAGCKRAAGMALNGALILEPNDAYGRTYVEHLAALTDDATAPERVRVSAKLVRDAQPPASSIVTLRTPKWIDDLLEATRDVLAHAYAIVKRHEGD